PDRLERLLAALHLGATLSAACECAGISRESLRRWRAQHPVIPLAVQQAEARRAGLRFDRIPAGVRRGPVVTTDASPRAPSQSPHRFTAESGAPRLVSIGSGELVPGADRPPDPSGTSSPLLGVAWRSDTSSTLTADARAQAGTGRTR